MPALYSDTAIIIFARQPVPGQVKTRLIPVLGEKNATLLYIQMLEQTLGMVADANLGAVYLYMTPGSDPQYFQSSVLTNNFKLRFQAGNDLGDNMFMALEQTLIKYKRVVLIGTDCPFLDTDDLHQAILALDTDKPCRNTMVFSPALDGGYVLVGASKVCQEVFKNIVWGSDKVMSQTRSVMEKLNIPWQELTTQQDIDSGEDLSALSQLKAFQHWSAWL